MKSMFYRAEAFNQDISRWNTSNVTGMSFMFNEAFAFNQDIKNWNVLNVQYVNLMFIDSGMYHIYDFIMKFEDPREALRKILGNKIYEEIKDIPIEKIDEYLKMRKING